MLVLSRRIGESLTLGDNITVRVIHVRGGRVRLAIDAPQSVRIRRQELPPPESINEQRPTSTKTSVLA